MKKTRLPKRGCIPMDKARAYKWFETPIRLWRPTNLPDREMCGRVTGTVRLGAKNQKHWVLEIDGDRYATFSIDNIKR